MTEMSDYKRAINKKTPIKRNRSLLEIGTAGS